MHGRECTHPWFCCVQHIEACVRVRRACMHACMRTEWARALTDFHHRAALLALLPALLGLAPERGEAGLGVRRRLGVQGAAACTQSKQVRTRTQARAHTPSRHTHLSSLTMAMRMSCSSPPLSFFACCVLGGIPPCCAGLPLAPPCWGRQHGAADQPEPVGWARWLGGPYFQAKQFIIAKSSADPAKRSWRGQDCPPGPCSTPSVPATSVRKLPPGFAPSMHAVLHAACPCCLAGAPVAPPVHTQWVGGCHICLRKWSTHSAACAEHACMCAHAGKRGPSWRPESLVSLGVAGTRQARHCICSAAWASASRA